MPAPPTTIAGRFDVERAVGHGGMGTVWLCRDKRLGRQVAVKQVGRLPGESSTHLSRALREARSSAALNHPHVVAVYDAVEEGDHAWLVMEYVPSRTLSEIVRDEGALSPEQVASIGAQAADGLAAAHAGGIIHRDVKPGNLLVTDQGVVKVTDFGIARTHGDEALTRSGIVLGTPGYFAPELARGHEPLPGADVWALGATLFTAVEGSSPYPEQSNALAMLARIANEPIPAPTRAGFLTEPIARMMDPDPATRWSMTDAAQVLQRLHQQHPVELRGGERTAASVLVAAAPAAAPPDEHEDEPTTVATPVEPTVLPAAQPTAEPTRGPATEPIPVALPFTAPPPGPVREERHGRRGLLAALAALVLVVAGVGAFALLSHGGNDPGSATGATTTPSRGTASASSSAPTPKPARSNVPSSSPASSAPPVVPPAPQSSEPTQESSAASGSGDPAAFATSYYSLLPGDTADAYALLSPSYQARTSRGDYEGFWRTIDAVSVGGTTVVDDTTVEVDLTYTSNGSSQQETRRLYLQKSGDGYLIASDAAV